MPLGVSGSAAPCHPYTVSCIELRKIGGALALFWAGGSGPTRAQIQSALMIAGYEGPDQGNKQELVQRSIADSDDSTAKLIIEELLSLLRESGYFEFGGHESEIDRLERAVAICGHELSGDGFIAWAAIQGSATARQPPSDSSPSSAVAHSQQPPAVGGVGTAHEVASPNLALLISSLRRVGAGAMRPVINRRRHDRPALRFDDEYDLQDVVEVLLRCLYNDVRQEEPTPSSAGSSSRIDLHLREGRTAIEVKVTALGRGEKQIKQEILIDINDYREHPRVDTLVVAIYDLAGTFKNPVGFEHDLGGNRDGLEVRVIVVPWVGPRAPT